MENNYLTQFGQQNISLDAELCNRHIEIHIKIQQRNARQRMTTVEGLNKLETPPHLSRDKYLENLSSKFKKLFNCSSTIIKPENIIKLSGDQRVNIKEFLLKYNLVNLDQIKIHGV